MGILRPKRTVIGVDIGRRTIKAAQLQRCEGGFHAFALSLLPRPEPEKDISRADAQALRKVLDRRGFEGNRIVLAAPEQRLMRAALELPPKVSGAPMGQIVRMEMSRLHNIAPDSFEMAYWIWRTPDGTRPMTGTLAIGCPHSVAGDLMDIFEAEDFDVAALDVRSAAATRACEPFVLPAPQITAIADLGWHSTPALFVCGRSLLYERLVEGVSAADLTGRLAEAFSVTPDAAQKVVNTVGLAEQEQVPDVDRETLDVIRRHLRAHFDRLLEELKAPLSYVGHQFPGDGVKRLLLIGGGAAVPHLAPYMQERLGLDVRVATPGDLLEIPAELLAKAGNPAMTVAVGLARFGGTG
jgi:Tfp pilus assembly PilM family ATPase